MNDLCYQHEGGLGEEIARKYFNQIVTAIQYCHKLHVVHRNKNHHNSTQIYSPIGEPPC